MAECVVGPGVEVQWMRLLLAVTLAAIPPAYFLSAMALLGDKDMMRSIALIATFLAMSWFLVLSGAPLLSFVANRWNGAHLQKACYLLGASAVFLLPLLSVTVVIYGGPMVMPAAKVGSTVPVEACLECGLLGQPYGWFAGWVVWRLGFPSATAGETGRFSRLWGALSTWRLVFSLCILPLLPATVFSGGVFYYSTRGFTDPWQPATLFGLCAWIGSAALIVATIGGAAFLYVNSRGRQGRVSLASCLTLGCMVVLVLPFACAAAGLALTTMIAAVATAMSWVLSGNSLYENFTFLLTVGAILVSLGLPGGWLLWQIGIAPAPRSAPLDTDPPIFD